MVVEDKNDCEQPLLSGCAMPRTVPTADRSKEVRFTLPRTALEEQAWFA